MGVMASKQKTRLVSWGAFCIDQKVLPKTVGPDTVAKLCDDRGQTIAFLMRDQKKKNSDFRNGCGEISPVRKSYDTLLRRAKGKQVLGKNEPGP